MNLLLLLSALLSALSGMGQVVRGAREPAAVCASVAVARPAGIAVAKLAVRPVQALPRLVVAPRLVLAGFTLVAAEPLYARRRRE